MNTIIKTMNNYLLQFPLAVAKATERNPHVAVIYPISPSAKVVELPKDVHLRKIKLSLIRMVGEVLFRLLEAALVLLVQTLTVLKLPEDNIAFLVPDLVVATLCNVSSASCDHLIGHLNKECRHPIRGVVVA